MTSKSEAPHQRAIARYEAGDLDGALAIYDALGDTALAHKRKGVILRQLGRFEAAESAFTRAVALAPDDDDAAYYLSMMQLWRGDFANGWAGYERRPMLLKFREMQPSLARASWDGSDLSGQRLLLLCEQGFGDNIQFVRYVQPLAARGAQVILRAPQELKRLFQTNLPYAVVTSENDAIPASDANALLLSLPRLTGLTSVKEIPTPGRYLRPLKELAGLWKTRLAAHAAPRIGLAWQGRTTHPDEQLRSLRLEALEPLLDAPAQFVSLQVDAPSIAELAACGHTDRLIDVSAELGDFADTAALLDQLDLVITADTAVGHLTAALNKPTWVMLPRVCDWRWLEDRDDTPWYPSMRLFRQAQAGEWGEVVNRVRKELATFIQGL